MTVAFKNPLSRKRFLTILLVIIVVIAVAVPVTLYWALERRNTHLIWDINARYSQQFLFHTDYASALLKGIPAPWSNATATSTENELEYANSELYGITVLDTAHANQLWKIFDSIESVKIYVPTMNSSARISLASQVYLLGHDIANAYWNFLNYTSEGVGAGPPFWYSGPSPPDEGLLQAAVNIAITFKTR